jgi:GGDEF domain-containing protein
MCATIDQLNEMTKEQLINLVCQLGIDGTFKLMTRDMATIFHSHIESGKILLFIDIANMHAMNHLYGMSTVDQFINNVIDNFRSSDTWIRWGSDEMVCIMNSGDLVEFIDRLDSDMRDNNLSAVYAHVTTSNSLLESISRADAICMNAKLQLERFGLKASRDEVYTRLTSVVVTE